LIQTCPLSVNQWPSHWLGPGGLFPEERLESKGKLPPNNWDIDRGGGRPREK